MITAIKMLDTAPVFEVLIVPLENSFYNIDKIFFSWDKEMKKIDAVQNETPFSVVQTFHPAGCKL